MVDILLSTYNGERFLKEQLDSIFAQSATDWHLLIRDDGSEDGTLDIINSYSMQYPEKISIVNESTTGNLGPCRSFCELMKKSTAPYVMFCDQDDIWLPEKIEVMLKQIRKIEKTLLPKTPLLLHSDMEVVDFSLATISNSFIKLNKLDIKNNSLNDLIMRNNITGCAMICNRLLIDFALPIPLDAIMHDWWLALVASEFGKIEYIPQTLIKYRQHDNNYYGAGVWKHTFQKYLKLGCYRRKVNEMSLQADSFYRSYKTHIDKQEISFIAKFAKFHTLSFLEKRWFVLKYTRHYLPLSKTVSMLILS